MPKLKILRNTGSATPWPAMVEGETITVSAEVAWPMVTAGVADWVDKPAQLQGDQVAKLLQQDQPPQAEETETDADE